MPIRETSTFYSLHAAATPSPLPEPDLEFLRLGDNCGLFSFEDCADHVFGSLVRNGRLRKFEVVIMLK
jgi:hypothetical protein